MRHYIFAYLNNRRVISGECPLSDKDAFNLAAKLSVEKKRVIVLKGEEYIYETERHRANLSGLDMPVGRRFVPIATFKNGKLDRRL